MLGVIHITLRTSENRMTFFHAAFGRRSAPANEMLAPRRTARHRAIAQGLLLVGGTVGLAACDVTKPKSVVFSNNPCVTSSLTLAVDASALVDCSNNGT